MAQNPKSNPIFITKKRVVLSFLIIFLFFGFSLAKISNHSLGFEELQNTNFDIGAIPVAQATVPIDVVFAGYNEEYIDLTMMNNGLTGESKSVGKVVLAGANSDVLELELNERFRNKQKIMVPRESVLIMDLMILFNMKAPRNLITKYVYLSFLSVYRIFERQE